jgi:hypothetical protein
LGRAKIKRESLTQISESQQALAIYFTMGKTTDSMAAWGAWGAWEHGSMGEHGRADGRRDRLAQKATFQLPASEASRAGRGREWK